MPFSPLWPNAESGILNASFHIVTPWGNKTQTICKMTKKRKNVVTQGTNAVKNTSSKKGIKEGGSLH